jgi:hypothetical protein
MERFVMVWTVSDGFTYSYVHNEPIFYESQEALYVHLEEDIKSYLDGDGSKHGILDRFDGDGFYGRAEVTQKRQQYDYKSKDGKFWWIFMPKIYTLDDWFDKKYNKII